MLPAALLLTLCAFAFADVTVTSVKCTASGAAPTVGVLAPEAAACKIYSGVVTGALVWAEYNDTIMTTGWADLRTHSVSATGTGMRAGPAYDPPRKCVCQCDSVPPPSQRLPLPISSPSHLDTWRDTSPARSGLGRGLGVVVKLQSNDESLSPSFPPPPSAHL